MERKLLGWTGVDVPVIGQGTWRMEEHDRATCIAALRAGIEAGMTHLRARRGDDDRALRAAAGAGE